MLIRYEISLDDDKCLVINSSYLSHQWLFTLQAGLTHKGILFHEIFRNPYCQFVCNSFSIQIAELYNTRKTNLNFIWASYTHIMKRKLKHWWSSIPTISTKQSSLINTKRPQHVTLEIQALAWDRHKNVVGLNQLMGSQHSSLDDWISFDNTTKNIPRFTSIQKDHILSQKWQTTSTWTV